jgi:hypothetical protein
MTQLNIMNEGFFIRDSSYQGDTYYEYCIRVSDAVQSGRQKIKKSVGNMLGHRKSKDKSRRPLGLWDTRSYRTRVSPCSHISLTIYCPLMSTFNALTLELTLREANTWHKVLKHSSIRRKISHGAPVFLVISSKKVIGYTLPTQMTSQNLTT